MKDLLNKKRQSFNKHDIQEIGKILLYIDDCEDKTSEYDGDETCEMILASKNHENEFGIIGIVINWGGEDVVFINPLTGGKVQPTNDQLDKLILFLNSDLVEREKHRQEEFNNLTINLINELDKDGNGIIDIIDSQRDFNNLLMSKQKEIINIDKSYIQSFVKLSNYLDTKGRTLQELFEHINKIDDESTLSELLEILNDRIQAFNLTLLHSLNMIVSLTKQDLITFYKIYETFDKSNIFQSNWEKEIQEKMIKIDEGIKSVLIGIESLERNLISEISNLSYVTQESFNDLNQSVTDELKGINSSINFNSLLMGVQTYQLYQINKSTKSLRG